MDTAEPPFSLLDRDSRAATSTPGETDTFGSGDSTPAQKPRRHQAEQDGHDRFSRSSPMSVRSQQSSISNKSWKKTSFDPRVRSHLSLADPGLTRHGTLLTANATPARAAAELKSILGNHHARLKSKATLVRVDSGSASFSQHVTLEQAKSRARVEVDILPQTNVCVQGGYLRGNVKISIRSATRKETPIAIAGGKIRVIGFESLGDKSKAIFYQCSAMLASVTPSLDGLYASERDAEGFAQAQEGEHEFPFSLYLSLSNDHGQAKGFLRSQPAVSLNYIAMVYVSDASRPSSLSLAHKLSSLKIKDEPGRHSIAHFYRSVEVWPRLDPTTILSPALRPLQATLSTNIPKDPKAGRIKLTASLHRLHWVAGQFCQVKIIIDNETPKTLKDLTLSLHRTITTFPRSSRSGVDFDLESREPEASTKLVTESVLEAGQPGAIGHASAKGWWSGIGPNQYAEFEHSILVPTDALTVPRGLFFEIEYSLRVTIASGNRIASDIQVLLPIRIVNFLSIDPPPSQPISTLAQTPRYSRPPCARQSSKASAPTIHIPKNFGVSFTPSAESHDPISVQNSKANTGKEMSSSDGSFDYLLYQQDTDECSSDYGDELGNLELGNLSLADDTDDVVQHAITTARMDLTYARFSDLYYIQDQINPVEMDAASRDGTSERSVNNSDSDSDAGALETLMEEVAMGIDSNEDSCGAQPEPPRWSLGVHRRSSFAARVEEKTRLATAAFLNGDRDCHSHQEQREDSSNSVQEHSVGKPNLRLKISPVLSGEKNQSSKGLQTAVPSHLNTSGTSERTQPGGDTHDTRTQTGPRLFSTSTQNPGPESLGTTSTTPISAPAALSTRVSPHTLPTPLFHREGQESTPIASVPLCSHCTMNIVEGSAKGGTISRSITQLDTLDRHTPDSSLDTDMSLPRVTPTQQVCVDGIKAPSTGARLMSPASATSTTSAASIGSVKDKIRQLEERVKAAALT